jgi:hypothetical protein
MGQDDMHDYGCDLRHVLRSSGCEQGGELQIFVQDKKTYLANCASLTLAWAVETFAHDWNQLMIAPYFLWTVSTICSAVTFAMEDSPSQVESFYATHANLPYCAPKDDMMFVFLLLLFVSGS